MKRNETQRRYVVSVRRKTWRDIKRYARLKKMSLRAVVEEAIADFLDRDAPPIPDSPEEVRA